MRLKNIAQLGQKGRVVMRADASGRSYSKAMHYRCIRKMEGMAPVERCHRIGGRGCCRDVHQWRRTSHYFWEPDIIHLGVSWKV
jgi:hypothetical protein